MTNLRFGTFYQNGIYHIYNRGVDKRDVFLDKQDKSRFLLLLDLVQSTEGIQSMQHLHKADFEQKRIDLRSKPKLVELVACALLPNHFHLVLRQTSDDGVSKFMQKLGTAYTKYFNEKYERTGALFAGKYKYTELTNDQDVAKMICYVNKNPDIHQIKSHPMSFSSEAYYALDQEWEWGNGRWGLGLFGSREHYNSVAREHCRWVIQQRKELLLE